MRLIRAPNRPAPSFELPDPSTWTGRKHNQYEMEFRGRGLTILTDLCSAIPNETLMRKTTSVGLPVANLHRLIGGVCL